MNFYEQTSNAIVKLSHNEQNIMTYVIKNMQAVKNMSIRDLASTCFVSTTTIFRFVKKLGYEGYAEFIDALSKTEAETRKIHIPSIIEKENYSDSYLKNIIEAVKVITNEKYEKFESIMSRNPDIYIIAEGLSREIGQYFLRLLTTVGFNVSFPKESYEKTNVLKKIKRDDVVLVLSYSGDNETVVHEIEKIFAIATPTIISFTRADNNAIQNMSDLNFYVFSDEINYEDIDITSRIGMIAIMETLLYKRIIKR